MQRMSAYLPYKRQYTEHVIAGLWGLEWKSFAIDTRDSLHHIAKGEKYKLLQDYEN